MCRVSITPRIVLPLSEVRSVSLPLLLAVALSAVYACTSQPKPTAQAATNDTPSLTDEQIFVGDTIEKNYDPNVIMKRAESFFEKEEYAEAALEYQHFLDLHRVHVLAPYAQFRLGESHYMMIKTIDRDPTPVTQALAAYQRLLMDFPGSRWESEARERIRACKTLLAQNAMFIGKFYYRREAYLAAARRFEAIVKEYPDLEEIVQEALYYLALSYHQLALEDWARESLVALSERFPNSKYQQESRKLLAKLNQPPSRPSPLASHGDTPTVSVPGRLPAPVSAATVPIPALH
jgi:outer membrane protein assembly factor BamD